MNSHSLPVKRTINQRCYLNTTTLVVNWQCFAAAVLYTELIMTSCIDNITTLDPGRIMRSVGPVLQDLCRNG